MIGQLKRTVSLLHSSIFTLIEVLVCISVIAILASILLPALKKAKNQVSEVACKSNLKQIGQCTFMYVDDNNGWLLWPGRTSDGNFFGSYYEENWINKLLPYTGGTPYDEKDFAKGIFECPAVVDHYEPNNGVWPTPLWYGGYGWNLYINYPSDPNYPPKKIIGVKHPTELFLDGDTIDYSLGSAGGMSRFGTMDACGIWILTGPNISVRHRGRGNYTFADGHVDSERAVDIVNDTNLFNLRYFDTK